MNPKQTIDQSVRAKMIKLKENRGKSFQNLQLGKDFLDNIPKV